MRKFNLTIIFLISLLSFCLVPSAYSALTYSTNISTQGSIDYNGHNGYMNLTLKFSSDFETVTKWTNWDMRDFGLQHTFVLSTGASFWIEGVDRTDGPTPHSGSRCVGQETVGDDSNRNEFIIYISTLGITNEFFIREWLYLPAEWYVHPNGDWYNLFQVTEYNPPNWNPWCAFMMEQADNLNGLATISMVLRDEYLKAYWYDKTTNWQVPRGRWFKFEWYEFRDNNGVVKCWIDGNLVFDVSGIDNHQVGNTEWWVETSKIYTWGGTYQLWVDDLEVYGR